MAKFGKILFTAAHDIANEGYRTLGELYFVEPFKGWREKLAYKGLDVIGRLDPSFKGEAREFMEAVLKKTDETTLARIKNDQYPLDEFVKEGIAIFRIGFELGQITKK